MDLHLSLSLSSLCRSTQSSCMGTLVESICEVHRIARSTWILKEGAQNNDMGGIGCDVVNYIFLGLGLGLC